MLRNRACWITGILVLAQVGIIAGYYTVLQGDAAPPFAEMTRKPAGPPRPAPEKKELPTPTGGEMPVAPPLPSVAPFPPDAKADPSGPVLPPALEGTAEAKKEKTAEPLPAPKGTDPAKVEPSGLPAVLAIPGTSGSVPCKPIDPGTVIKVMPPVAPFSGPMPPKVEESLIQASATSTFSGIVPATSLTVPPPMPNTGTTSSVVPVVLNPAPVPRPPVVISPLEKKPAAATVCPWTLRVALVDGKTQLIAQSGKEVQFRVTCNQLNLQAPNGTIEAQGAVHLSSTDLEGEGERMTISWQEDLVVLDGQAQVKCHRDGQDLELRAVRLSLRLTPVPKAATTKSLPKSDSPNDDQEESSAEGEAGVSGE